ncbi:DUF305 domain-containing protein [Lacisediminihabitans changchengi]|uniref:DUF305 domain-containing protein n=1 Tax=Lacisediminihabitans changchengi TaxID=2787634 RepID=A0A934SVF3_9MICO|nr:DUF305 domain-containing protein [Lacisediminihabitans changchengi]MBK4348749.1 DUF305 domain-containing protein [Lacisediminihabitans changchengi]
MNTRSTLLVSSALALTVLLAGCSTGTVSGTNHSSSAPAANSTATGPHNDADIAFALNMAAHHQQAIEMADMVLAKTGVDGKVTDLAKKIKAEQAPEITLMKSWLTAWGQSTDSSGMSGMEMNGMMSQSDMDALKSADGTTSSTLFLTQMTQHHQGAIDMSKEELSTGKNAAALELAKNIISAQTTEISTMKQLLAGN